MAVNHDDKSLRCERVSAHVPAWMTNDKAWEDHKRALSDAWKILQACGYTEFSESEDRYTASQRRKDPENPSSRVLFVWKRTQDADAVVCAHGTASLVSLDVAEEKAVRTLLNAPQEEEKK